MCPCLLQSQVAARSVLAAVPAPSLPVSGSIRQTRQPRVGCSRRYRCSIVGGTEPRALCFHSDCCCNAALLPLCSSSAAASRTIWSFTRSVRSASANFGRRIWWPTIAFARCSKTLRKCNVGSSTKRTPWREQERGLALEPAALDEAAEAAETLEARESAKVAEAAVEATISATTPTRKTADPPGVATQRRRINAPTTPLDNLQRDAPLADMQIHPPRGAAAFRLSTPRPPLQLPRHLPLQLLRHTRRRHVCH